ncbi:class I SAM-dependent methyltransferase [Kineococcus siccus]|uniref:class I SAM-dependent methyltransferase n=1 Tax=Kineococcus siccus TaxID=2696567 RepID=UPI0030B814C7
MIDGDAPDHPDTREDRTRQAWEEASGKHVREYDALLAEARGARLLPVEEELLGPLLARRPDVLHPQSGHGIDDIALIAAGARSVVGLDYSATAVGAAQQRADELGRPCRYLLTQVPPFPVDTASADLVYTGKGALIWLPDLDTWAAEVVRVLRPGGHLFVHEAHPAVPLWSWDEDEARIRPDRSYFARTHVNDTFPALGAVEHQHTLAEIVMAVTRAGLQLLELLEHPEPFWRPVGARAQAWEGRLPNSFTLLASVDVTRPGAGPVSPGARTSA